jgi:hypothetical protein
MLSDDRAILDLFNAPEGHGNIIRGRSCRIGHIGHINWRKICALPAEGMGRKEIGPGHSIGPAHQAITMWENGNLPAGAADQTPFVLRRGRKGH